MKTFLKYDFYFQLALYIFSILGSLISGEFQYFFLICLFFIGCSQTISFIIRFISTYKKNKLFNYYSIGYGIFFVLLLIFNSDLFKNELLIIGIVFINIMALLFLVSGYIDYKKSNSENMKTPNETI